jgi:hypothetical protein
MATAALVAGCASNPPPPAPAPQVQPLAEYMTEAAKARSERLVGKERDTYRTAARLYPTSKEPWAKLAEGYFEAADYGNAILAAQEVLQRDPADPLAASVLAVSGLRVSTNALSTLRTQNNNSLPADTRSQAEGLTRTLRELLGETVLVPPPADAAAPAATAAPAPARRPAPRPAAPPKPAAPVAAPAPATAPAPAKAPAPAPKPVEKSPFDALK